jgi:hypothetical protein
MLSNSLQQLVFVGQAEGPTARSPAVVSLFVLLIVAMLILRFVGIGRFVRGAVALAIVFGVVYFVRGMTFRRTQPEWTAVVPISHSQFRDGRPVGHFEVRLGPDGSKVFVQSTPEVEIVSSKDIDTEVDSASLESATVESATIESAAEEADVDVAAEADATEDAVAESASDDEVQPEQASHNPPRPAWVDAPPRRVGNVDRRVVSAGPWETVAECRAELKDKQLMPAFVDYFNATFDTSIGEAVVRGQLGITAEYVQNKFCPEEFVETTRHNFGDMKMLHALMEIGPSDRDELQHRWVDYRRRANLAKVALGGGGVLGLLAMVYGLLKVDTWTKGYYSKRLFVGVPAAVGATLAALAWMVS